MMGTRAASREHPLAGKPTRPHSASVAVGSGTVRKEGDSPFTRHVLLKQQSSLDDGGYEAEFEGIQVRESSL